MIARLLSFDVGINPYCVRKKEWVQLASAAIGAVGSLLGGAASARKAKKAELELAAKQNREDAWFQRRYNENYADTAAGRAMINEAKDYARENWKKASGAAAVTGGTDAATAQAKEAGNKVVGDAIRNMAVQDTARKDSAENAHLRMQDNYSNQKIALAQQNASNVASTAAGLSNAAMTAAASFGDGTKKAPDLKGESNTGMVTQTGPDGNTTAVQKGGKTIFEEIDESPYREQEKYL